MKLNKAPMPAIKIKKDFKDMIPVNEPLLHDEDFEYLKEAFKSGWISSAGKYIEEFEEGWAKYCGMKYGISVSNGTAALQIAIEAAGIGENDEVIIPDFTIISCAQAITNVGAIPIPIDSRMDTWCIDESKIEQQITKNTKAIMVVHMYGHVVDMDAIIKISNKYNLVIIEDAAEVHGAKYLSKRHTDNSEWLTCGGLGHISTFSFFANKLITTGEGGMVVFREKKLSAFSKIIRDHGMNPDRRYWHDYVGSNYRLTNIQAAIGVSQLNRINKIIKIYLK